MKKTKRAAPGIARPLALMNLLKRLFSKNLLNDAPNEFPYNEARKKEELIENIKKGVLFESSNSFLDWNLTYAQIECLCEKVKEGGDRTLYYFGKQTILNGVEIPLNSMKWMWTKKNVSFGSVNWELGQDSEGREKAFEIIRHITEQLGDPNKKELEKEEINALWQFGKIEVRVTSWCHFVTRYNFKLGLIKEPNWKK